MKKIYIPLVVTCMSIVLFFTCTKDVDVQFSFPFEIVESHDAEAIINYGTPIQVQIIPERIVQDHIYRFKYTVLEGEGFLRYANQDPLLEDTFHDCESLEMDLEFIGTELDDCKIEFTVEDIEGLTETILINYEVIHSPFNMDVNTTSTELVIGKNTPIVFRLENIGEDDSVTYETSISFQQGSGTIYKTNDIGESTFEITPNTYFPVAEGLQFYNVVLDETGESSILFQIRDSNGQLKEESLSFNTDVIDFTYVGAPQQNALFLGESTNLNFEINELLHGGDVYESRYEINSGNAVIRRTIDNIEDVLSPGINYPVDANAYYWEIQPLEAGTVDITFFAKNVSGIEKELQISIDVSNGIFEFQATNTINFAAVNDAVLVNFLITETGPQEPPYTMVFESSSNGVLEIEGLTYNPGELIPIEQLNFIGTYKGLINGTHDILFTVTNALNEPMTDDFSITFNEESFIFTAIAEESNIYVHDNTNINFNISEDTDDATYQMYYTVSGSGNSSLTSGHIHFSAGTFYEVLNGAFSWGVNALSEGNLTYMFYVSNNSDFVQSQVVDFTINPIPINDFNFTAISSANTATTGEKIPVNFNITETEDNSTYTMVFTSTEEGTFDYNGITYNQGEPIAVTSGNFTGSYNGSVSGAHQVVFTVTNANAIPISHSDDIAITFDNIDFNLSTTGDSSLYVGNSEDINLYLTQVQNDENIMYSVVYSFNSNSAGGGEIKSDDNTSIILGQSYPISPGNSSISFKATQIGLVIIDITVTDSNNIFHTSQVTFDVENIDFTFSGAPQQNTIETGAHTNLNFNINEAVTSGASYQMKYEILSGNGNVRDGGTIQAVNTYYNVNTGSYSWEFESVQSGSVELFFTILNTTTNVTQTQTVTITVNEPPVSDFSFTAISSVNTATVGESVPVNLNITETVGSSTYGMVFASTGTGTFDYNGITYNQGEPIAVTSGNFTGSYNGSVSGVHQVVFTVTNVNAIPISHSDDIAITFDNVDFNLSTSGDSSLYVGTSEDFNVHLSQVQIDNGISYTVAYSIASNSVGSGEIITNLNTPVTLGQAYPIDLGTTTMFFNATSVGIVYVDVSVTDSNNHTKTSRVTFDVDSIDFTFSGAPQQNTIETGAHTNLNFNINEAVTSGASYQMKYEILSGNGNVRDGGTIQAVNTYYNVNTGSYSWEFEAADSGTVELFFTALNTTTNVTHTQTVSITVNEPPVSDFSFTAISSANTATVGESVPVNLNITETVGSSTYAMVFTSTGTGTFDYNGITYTQGEPITVTPGNFTGAYNGIASGTHTITFTATNANAIPISHSDDIAITFDNVDFNLSTSGDSSLYVGTSEDFNVHLSQVQIDNGISYTVAYSIASNSVGSGEITTNLNTPVTLGQPYPIDLGTTTMFFNAMTVGVVYVDVSVTDSNNQTKTSRVTFDVDNIDFSFSGAPQQNTIETGETTNLNFNINEAVTSGAAYQMKYEILSGNGNVKDGGTTQAVNTYYNVNTGSYSWEFESTESGSVELFFTALNTTTNVTQTQTVTITVNEPPVSDFSFTAISSANTATIGESVPVNLNITETVGNSTYTMVFTSSATGIFEYNGVEYTQGQPIPVNPGNFTGAYRSGTAEIHNIFFEVTNSNTIPITKNDSFNITYNLLDFTFSGAVQQNTIETGESTFLNFNISETFVSGNNYEMKFEILNGNGHVKDGGLIRSVNTYFNVNIGTYSWEFEGTVVGTVELLFTARNTTTNVEHTKTINILVTIPPVSNFTFSAISSANTANEEESVPINFNITETVGESTYSMVFTSTGTGILNYNGNTYNQGQPITVSPGNFTAVYTGNSSGNHDITFIVTNNNTNPLSYDENVSITFNSLDFMLSTVGDGSLFLNSAKDFYTILSQESNDNSITYKVRFTIINGSSGEGQIKYSNNTSIPLGSYLDGVVDIGSTSFLFQGTSLGEVNLLVEVLDSDNRYKSSTITFNIDDVPFTFTAAEEDGSIEIGESTNVFLNVTEATESFTQYEIKYQIVSSETGQIRNNGITINPNTYASINIGSTPWTFTGTEEGSISVLFTVRNKNTLSVKTETINIEVNQIPSEFTFTAISSTNNAKVNECTDININLIETVGNSSYSMVYTSSESGTLEYNGNTYTQGQPITIFSGNFVVCYTGHDDGLDHDIEFTITNAENLSKGDDISIFIESINNFDFLGSVNNSTVIVNDNVSVNFTLAELVGNSGYTVVFNTDGDGTFEYNGNTYSNGQTISSFPVGSSSGKYYPTSIGNHLISFTASNSELPVVSKNYQTLLNVTQANMSISFSKLSFYESESGTLYFDVDNAGVYTIRISTQDEENGFFCNPQAFFCTSGFGSFSLNSDISLNLDAGITSVNFNTNKSIDTNYNISISDGINTINESFEIEVEPHIIPYMGYTKYQSSNGSLTSCIANSPTYLGAVTSYTTKVRAYISSNSFYANGVTIDSYDIRYNNVITSHNYSLSSFNSNGGTYTYRNSYSSTPITESYAERTFNNVLVLGTSTTFTVVDKFLSLIPSNANTPCGDRVYNAMTSGKFNQNYLNPGNSFEIRIHTSNGKTSNWATTNSAIPTSFAFVFLDTF